ncbi:hypothetical protein DFH06DRAFT_698199 [Mycena polygramma]|nr:hypothetical protein DFH06DRAFT_698199 [Mycena polygramma]
MTLPQKPAHSLVKKGSGFLNFWKKSRPASTDLHTEIPESDIVLPTEIWLDILTYIEDHALAPLSQICRRMRWIVLPFYFRSQQMFPFMETFAFRMLRMSTELAGYEERAIQRLQFLRSEHISHGIKELFVSPYPPGYNRRHRVEHRPVEAVMLPLVSSLPRFQNLKKLVLQSPLCDDSLYASLESLRLDSFELEVPPTALGDVPIPAQREFFFNLSTSPTQNFPSDELSLRLLFPECIEHIVAGPTGTITLARTLLRYPSGLNSLKTLDLSLHFVGSQYFVDALLACPNLTSLHLSSSAIYSGIPPPLAPLPKTAIPLLTTYHGPAIFAPMFSHGRTLRTVCLWASHSVSAVTPPWSLMPILQQLGPTVTSLELALTLVPDVLLESLRDLFPALTALSINAHLDSFHPGTVTCRILPPSDSGPIRVRLALPAGLNLQTLRLGAQLAGAPAPAAAAQEMRDSAREAVRLFPSGYDPTSWRRWVVDRPWYCIEWTRVPEEERAAEFGTALDGTLSIEYGDHYFRGFQRGERISERSVEEAVQRMT